MCGKYVTVCMHGAARVQILERLQTLEPGPREVEGEERREFVINDTYVGSARWVGSKAERRWGGIQIPRASALALEVGTSYPRLQTRPGGTGKHACEY